MKKFLSIIAIFCFFSLKAQSSSLTECESILKNHQYQKNNHTWKYFNYEASYGKILRKEVFYINPENPAQSKTYWLFQIEDTGYFYFGNLHNKKEGPKFYSNEDDAIRALFIWQCCKVYLDQGLISEDETFKINAQN